MRFHPVAKLGPWTIFDPTRRPIDGGRLSGLACRSLEPARSTREKVADVHCASAPAVFRVRVRHVMSRGRRPRGGRPLPEGANHIAGVQAEYMQIHINVAVNIRLVNPTGFNRRPERDGGTGATLVIALATVLAVTAANAGQMAVRDPGAR